MFVLYFINTITAQMGNTLWITGGALIQTSNCFEEEEESQTLESMKTAFYGGLEVDLQIGHTHACLG